MRPGFVLESCVSSGRNEDIKVRGAGQVPLQVIFWLWLCCVLLFCFSYFGFVFIFNWRIIAL